MSGTSVRTAANRHLSNGIRTAPCDSDEHTTGELMEQQLKQETQAQSVELGQQPNQDKVAADVGEA
jgi:hypothetical protein